MKRVYFFGNGKADGTAKNKNLLGGKGANLAEMTNLGIPVPPGFTITTKVCIHFMESGEYPDKLKKEIQNALEKIEKIMGQKFEIDVEILVPHDLKIETDDIRKTVNYSDLYDKIIDLFSEKKYNLIETLANKISIAILEKFNVRACKVVIRKPDVPINGKLDFVEVEVDNYE